MYTKSETAADFVYISESDETWEKHLTQRLLDNFQHAEQIHFQVRFMLILYFWT